MALRHLRATAPTKRAPRNAWLHKSGAQRNAARPTGEPHERIRYKKRMAKGSRLPLFTIETGERRPGIDFDENPRYRDYLKAVYDFDGNILSSEIQHIVPVHEPTPRQRRAIGRAHDAAQKKRSGAQKSSHAENDSERTPVRREVRNHLAKLHHNGYLRRYGRKNLVIYTLGPKAIDPLVLYFDADPKRAARLQARANLVDTNHLKHSRMISRLHFLTEMALRDRPAGSLAFWRHDGEVNADVWFTGANQKRRRVPVIPDAYFGIADRDNPITSVFLEADRTTSTHERFTNKVLGYYHFWKRQGKKRPSPCEELLNIVHFTVLTACISPSRMQGLYESTRRALMSDPVYKQASDNASKKAGERAQSGVAFVHEDEWHAEKGFVLPDLRARFIPFL